MTRRSRIVLAFLITAAGSRAGAQQRPDFSGVWARAADSPGTGATVAATGDAAFRRGDMGSGWGSPLTITQSGNRLAVVFDFFTSYDLQPKVRYGYALDGTESKNVVMVGHSESPMRSRATWASDTLVITSKFVAPPGVDPKPGTPDVRQALSLDASGRLVIAVTRRGAGGAAVTIIYPYTRR